MQRRIPRRRKAGFTVDGEPDFVRGLRGQFVEHERGQQADNPARDAGGRLGETMVLGHVVPGDGVDASAEAGNHPGRQRGDQGGPRQSNLSEIPGPKDRSSVQEPAQFLILRRGHGVTLQNVGAY